MQQKEESKSTPAQNEAAETPNQMATNPNPRANENITEVNKSPGDQKHSTGTEITDGEDA